MSQLLDESASPLACGKAVYEEIEMIRQELGWQCNGKNPALRQLYLRIDQLYQKVRQAKQIQGVR